MSERKVQRLRTWSALTCSIIYFLFSCQAIDLILLVWLILLFFALFWFLTESSEDASLSRSTSVATGLNIMKRQKVKTIFPHTAGSNKTLLSFAQGDIITLLVAEEKDGWLYGEHETTKV